LSVIFTLQAVAALGERRQRDGDAAGTGNFAGSNCGGRLAALTDLRVGLVEELLAGALDLVELVFEGQVRLAGGSRPAL
jgi:hypothetical protein